MQLTVVINKSYLLILLLKFDTSSVQHKLHNVFSQDISSFGDNGVFLVSGQPNRHGLWSNYYREIIKWRGHEHGTGQRDPATAVPRRINTGWWKLSMDA